MRKRPSVYIENTIISYLTAWPSRSLVAAAWQRITNDWWWRRRDFFELYISELVIVEASAGDSEAAQRRLASLKGIPEVPITDEVRELARALTAEGAFATTAAADALHVAAAAVHRMDYLLTWNYRHIDNAETKPLMRTVCTVYGYQCPEICTPQELMGEDIDEG